MRNAVLAHNTRAEAVWGSPGGRYDAISRTIADAISHAVVRLDPRSGERVLDLATGTGWASREVARRCANASVVGADIAAPMLDHARDLAAREALTIDYRHADAEALPFEAATFDAVISTFGVMFVAQPEVAVREIARILKPGGRLVLSSWKPEGGLFDFFATMKRHMPASPAGATPPPSPFEWGKVERLHALLDGSFDVQIEEGTNVYRYATGEEAWGLWVSHYGPTKALAESLDDAMREALHRDLVALHETFTTPLGLAMVRPYLVTRALRR